MNNNFRKINLYILSLGLLFVFLIIITIKFPNECFDIKDFGDWKDILLLNIIPIICLIMLFYSFFAYKKFEFDLKGTTDIPFSVTKIESINYEHLTFLATYIIPLISFDFESFRQMIVLGLLLVVMGVIYIKTDLFYANPSLALLGFYIYKANGSFKNGIRDNIVIISREKFIIGQKVSYIKLDDRIYYAKGVN
ncbi:anti-phage protein KwaA [Aliarcobacter cryaerophilus]|jgi:hypothetical protein|uniref:anti-phage protein KwaA n=1 Tax=Aliarcobacter cryaerophilus TaxID=28198 RepID=UPI0008241938|nr:anti-phage protein KwaA [Aliarcobacter cryaerophilus]MCT7544269.1 hypothetical protein [Aliarcobacter cryaerophilus]